MILEDPLYPILITVAVLVCAMVIAIVFYQEGFDRGSRSERRAIRQEAEENRRLKAFICRQVGRVTDWDEFLDDDEKNQSYAGNSYLHSLDHRRVRPNYELRDPRERMQ